MNTLAQTMPYIPDLRSGLTVNTFPSEKFRNGQTHRNERLRELQSGCRAWEVLFQEKEKKNKEEELAKLGRKKERVKKK
jgi:hypothetical protein